MGPVPSALQARPAAGAQFLRLRGGTFLIMAALQDALMLRECYKGLEAKRQALFADGAQAVVVIGNPGDECIALLTCGRF